MKVVARSKDAIAGPAPPKTPRRTFVVISLALAVLAVHPNDFGAVLVLNVGPAVLAAAYDVRYLPIGLLLLSFGGQPRPPYVSRGGCCFDR